jgi:phage tail-like protein
LHVRPDSRYLKFLPTVYREVDLIGRLLKVFEQSLDPAIQTLEMLWAYLDPLTAPEALLPFLAYWVGWPSDVNWSYRAAAAS